jgi:hypothetical protein
MEYIMQTLKSFFILIFTISAVSLSSQTLTPDQQHELALIQRDQCVIQYNDQLFAALMRSFLARNKQPSWLHLNMQLWTSFQQITAEALIDYSFGGSFISLFGGWQVFMLDYEPVVPGLYRDEKNIKAVSMNIPFGVNLYLRELVTLAAGGSCYV